MQVYFVILAIDGLTSTSAIIDPIEDIISSKCDRLHELLAYPKVITNVTVLQTSPLRVRLHFLTQDPSKSIPFSVDGMNKMFCEHPTCSLEANTTCKYHCHLSVCQQHRFEHEQNLLTEFEKELHNLSDPVLTLLNQSQYDLKQSEESHQHELNHINCIFNRHLSSIDQRLKLSKTTIELLSKKREQLIKYKNGDNQLTKDDYQQIENLLNQIQNNLHEQYQLNNEIRNKNSNIDLWPIDKETNVSTEIECIVVSDSEDELLENSIDQSKEMNDTLSLNNMEILPIKVNKKQERHLTLLRDFCPLTEYGIFGLNSSYNLSNLCSKKTNKQRCLYGHFIRTHRIKSSIAYQLVKAIRNGCDPIQTKIFPQDNTSAFIESIQCPFDDTAKRFNNENSIPNTPCYSLLAYHCFKIHLRNMHSITKLNTDLIYNAMKDYGNISSIQFEEDLCEIK